MPRWCAILTTEPVPRSIHCVWLTWYAGAPWWRVLLPVDRETPHRMIFGLPLQILLAFVAVFLCSFFYT